ncbi:MAG: hypothetical protein ACI8QT_000013 [Halioglobus sp.]|jgi:RNase P/RNase MRP subunit p29
MEKNIKAVRKVRIVRSPHKNWASMCGQLGEVVRKTNALLVLNYPNPHVSHISPALRSLERTGIRTFRTIRIGVRAGIEVVPEMESLFRR